MTRSLLRALIAIAAVAALSSTGCKPKPPATPPSPDRGTQTSMPSDVDPAPEPRSDRDDRQQPWPADLAEATEMAYTRGLLGTVYFEFDSAQLDTPARERLSKNAQFLTSEGDDFVVTIEGHCDERGTNEYNIALGDRRANAAREYLISLGVDPSRVRTVSFGEERATCTQSSEACWSQNRRAYFRITGRS